MNGKTERAEYSGYEEYDYDYFPESHRGFVNDLYFEQRKQTQPTEVTRQQNGLNNIELVRTDLAILTAQHSEKMDSAKFQRYKRFYGKTCLFGSLGCRWRRYQHSKADTTLWDLLFFAFLVFVTCFSLVLMYFWAVCANNDRGDINWFLSMDFGRDYYWTQVALGINAAIVVYLLLLLILSFIHCGMSYEIYIHKVHKLFIVVCCSFCVAQAVITASDYREGWSLVYHSLQMYGIYLQASVVIVMTFISWLIAGQWVGLETIGCKLLWLPVYLTVMVLLYTSPVFIDSPCLITTDQLPARPQLVAHRGNSQYAPENTMEAFRQAVIIPGVVGVETDITFSSDSIAVLMHDHTLRRTTDVADVYPELQDEAVYNFNSTMMAQLSAGRWFYQTDPYKTARHLTPQQKQLYANQTIPHLSELLQLLKQANKSLLFDFKSIPYEMMVNDTHNTVVAKLIAESGIPPKDIWWLWGQRNFTDAYTRGDRGYDDSPELLARRGIKFVLDGYLQNWRLLQSYSQRNLSVGVYPVNTRLFYSFCWCSGATWVITDVPQHLADIHTPLTMSPTTFRSIWGIVSGLSFVIIVLMFVIQWRRHNGQLQAEMSSLQVVRHRISQIRQSKNMKEKLIRAAEGLQESTVSGFVGIEKEQSVSQFKVPAEAQSPAGSHPVTPTSCDVTSACGDVTQEVTVLDDTQSDVSAVSLSSIPAEV